LILTILYIVIELAMSTIRVGIGVTKWGLLADDWLFGKWPAVRKPLGCRPCHFVGKRLVTDRAVGTLVSGQPTCAGGCAETEISFPLRSDHRVLRDRSHLES
jgi:hypothetical protein